MMRALLWRRRPETGASAVEFALVVVPLLYLVFGVIGYGYMLSFRQALSQAGAEGARAAAITPGGLSNPDLLVRARQAVDDSLGTYGVTCASGTGLPGSLVRAGSPAGTCKVELLQTCTGSTTGAKCVKVSLDYTYRDDALLPDVGFGFVLPSNLKYVSEVQVS